MIFPDAVLPTSGPPARHKKLIVIFYEWSKKSKNVRGSKKSETSLESFHYEILVEGEK